MAEQINNKARLKDLYLSSEAKEELEQMFKNADPKIIADFWEFIKQTSSKEEVEGYQNNNQLNFVLGFNTNHGLPPDCSAVYIKKDSTE